MDVRLGRHRHEEREVIDTFGNVRENAADPPATLAILLELEGALHDVARRAGRSFNARTGIELLAMQFDQLRLVIEGIHLADAAIHEKLHDALDPGAMMPVSYTHL